jgi:hypothetical protein
MDSNSTEIHKFISKSSHELHEAEMKLYLVNIVKRQFLMKSLDIREEITAL